MKDISKEWLKVNRICRDIKWMIYDIDYKDIELGKALIILEQLKEKLRKQLDSK